MWTINELISPLYLLGALITVFVGAKPRPSTSLLDLLVLQKTDAGLTCFRYMLDGTRGSLVNLLMLNC